MKKRSVRILLICVALGCVLTAAYFLWPREKRVYELGTSYTNCPQAEEIAWWSGSNYFQDEEAAETKAVSWQGKIYEGVYYESSYLRRMSFLVDEYHGDDLTSFQTRRSDGSLVYLNVMDRSFFDTQSKLDDIPDTEASLEKIAKGYAAQFVDVDEYQKEVSTETFGDDGVALYNFKFVRRIHGRDTSDFVWIRLTSKGHLADIFIGDIGAFSKISKRELNSFADIDVVEMLEKATEGSLVTNLESEAEWYTVTPAGELVLHVVAEFECVNKDGYGTYQTNTAFIIK